MIAEIEWRTTESVASVAEMDALLDGIAAQSSEEFPQAVNVTRSNGDSLTIVLGAAEGSLLNFISASQEPPYITSAGDPSADGVFTFYVSLDHHSEASASNVILEAKARQVVREFVALTYGLPDTIGWEEV